MVCPKCGKRNKKDAEKCVVCGRKLIIKNAKEKADELVLSITSTIDVKAIKKAEKSLIYNLKHLSPKIIISSIIILILIFTTIFLSIGFNSISCTYKSKEDNWAYKSNINFNYKNDNITRFRMRLEYSSSSNKYKEEFENFYKNIVGNLEDKDNFKYIVKSSKGNRHFSIVYNFSPNYIEQVYDYTGITIDGFETIDDFKNSLEESGFKCH